VAVAEQQVPSRRIALVDFEVTLKTCENPYAPAVAKGAGRFIRGAARPNDWIEESKRIAVLKWLVLAPGEAEYGAVRSAKGVRANKSEAVLHFVEARAAGDVQRHLGDLPIQTSRAYGVLRGWRGLEASAEPMPRRLLDVEHCGTAAFDQELMRHR
jgi:hypothetical protein